MAFIWGIIVSDNRSPVDTGWKAWTQMTVPMY